jgi:hypothetical protein
MRNEIYLSIAELDLIKKYISDNANLADTQVERQTMRQLSHKLNKLRPEFGAQIISDPSTYSEEA